MAKYFGSYDEDRRQMVDETSQFIDWGLKHPERVRWIPTRRVGSGNFNRTMQLVFWTPVLGASLKRPVSWIKSILRR